MEMGHRPSSSSAAIARSGLFQEFRPATLKLAAKVLVFLSLVHSPILTGCYGPIIKDNAYEVPPTPPGVNYDFTYAAGTDSATKNAFPLLLAVPPAAVTYPDYWLVGDLTPPKAVLAPVNRIEVGHLVDVYTHSLADEFAGMMEDRGFDRITTIRTQPIPIESDRMKSELCLALLVSFEITTKSVTIRSPKVETDLALSFVGVERKNFTAGSDSGNLVGTQRVTLEAYEPRSGQLVWNSGTSFEIEQPYTFKWNAFDPKNEPRPPHRTIMAGLNHLELSMAVGADMRPQAVATMLEQSFSRVLDWIAKTVNLREVDSLRARAAVLRSSSLK